MKEIVINIVMSIIENIAYQDLLILQIVPGLQV